MQCDDHCQIWSIYCIDTSDSESEGFELCVDLGNGFIINSLLLGSNLLLLGVEELLGFDLSLLFKSGDKFFSSPSSHLSEVSVNAEVSVSLHSDNLKGLWDNHSLLLVIWRWDSFEDLDVLKSSLTLWGLVREHSSDGSPEHSRWGSVMLELSSWVGVVGLIDELLPFELLSEERTRHVHELTSDDNNSLTS